MEWTRTETLALAAEFCKTCEGTGQRPNKDGDSDACNCVFRAIFRACYNRFVNVATKEKYMSRVMLERCSNGNGGRNVWGRKDEEYLADFLLTTRRSLTDFDHKIFKAHYLLGADWKLCCRQLKIDKGTFFHSVYRLQERLGRVYREMQPYALFPLDEYFQGTVRIVAPNLIVFKSAPKLSDSVPLKKAA